MAACSSGKKAASAPNSTALATPASTNVPVAAGARAFIIESAPPSGSHNGIPKRGISRWSDDITVPLTSAFVHQVQGAAHSRELDQVQPAAHDRYV